MTLYKYIGNDALLKSWVYCYLSPTNIPGHVEVYKASGGGYLRNPYLYAGQFEEVTDPHILFQHLPIEVRLEKCKQTHLGKLLR